MRYNNKGNFISPAKMTEHDLFKKYCEQRNLKQGNADVLHEFMINLPLYQNNDSELFLSNEVEVDYADDFIYDLKAYSESNQTKIECELEEILWLN